MITETVNGYVLSAVIMLLGGMVAAMFGNWLSIGRVTSVLLYCWHTVFAVAYYLLILSTGGDAIAYYQRAQIDAVSLKAGTDFVIWFTSFPVDWGFSFLATSLLYNVFGALGLLLLFASLKEETDTDDGHGIGALICIGLVLLPSLSFWSSTVGKDSIAFMAVTLFAWSSLHLQRRFAGVLIAVLIMFAVRPHMAVLMIMSVGAGALLQQRLGGAVRMGFGLAAAAAAAIVVPLAIIYVKVDQFTDVSAYVDTRQGQTNEGGSGIDIGGMNPIARVAGYLYRPLPNEAYGFAQLTSSAENIVLMILTAIAVVLIVRVGVLKVFREYSIMLLYSLGALIILSQVTGNLGIAARQKWMAIPALIIVCIGAWASTKRKASTGKRYRLRTSEPQAVL